MKKLFLLFLLFFIAGCVGLKNKSFSYTSSMQGGKVVLTDPSTGSMFPTFFGGTWHQSILTVPLGVKKVKKTVKSYAWWGTLLLEEKTEVEINEDKPCIPKSK